MKKKVVTILMAVSLASVSLLTACASGNAAAEQPAATPEAEAQTEDASAEQASEEQPAKETTGEEMVLKFSTISTTDIQKEVIGKFTSHIEENIPRVKFEMYINGELYTNAEEQQAAIGEGIVDCSLEGDMAMSWAAPEWISWTSIPFAFNSKEHAMKFFTSEVGDEINDKLASDYNMRFLNNVIGARGGRMLTANKEIKSPDDLKGVKMRTPNVIGTVASWESLGATVISVSWGDLFNALQTGVVEAQENPYLELESGAFYQVQKYIMETAHQYGPQVFWINESKWQAFTPQEQEIVLEANKIALDYFNEQGDVNDERIKQTILDNGNIIIPAEDIDLEAFKSIIIEQVVNSDVTADYAEGGWDYIQSLDK